MYAHKPLFHFAPEGAPICGCQFPGDTETKEESLVTCAICCAMVAKRAKKISDRPAPLKQAEVREPLPAEEEHRRWIALRDSARGRWLAGHATSCPLVLNGATLCDCGLSDFYEALESVREL